MLNKHDVKKQNLLDDCKKDKLLFYLKANYPEALSEGKVSLESLSRILGLESRERGYELNFTGKPLATSFYNTQSTKELQLESSFNPANPLTDSNNVDSNPLESNPNVIIKGDNLDALKLLKSAYYEKIKMIYIDPLIIRKMTTSSTLMITEKTLHRF